MSAAPVIEPSVTTVRSSRLEQMRQKDLAAKKRDIEEKIEEFPLAGPFAALIHPLTACISNPA